MNTIARQRLDEGGGRPVYHQPTGADPVRSRYLRPVQPHGAHGLPAQGFRRVATRYDKLASNYAAAVHVTGIAAFWLNLKLSPDPGQHPILTQPLADLTFIVIADGYVPVLTHRNTLNGLIPNID